MGHTLFQALNATLTVSDCEANNSVESLQMEMTEILGIINPQCTGQVQTVPIAYQDNLAPRTVSGYPQTQSASIGQSNILHTADCVSNQAIESFQIDQPSLGVITRTCVGVTTFTATYPVARVAQQPNPIDESLLYDPAEV